MWPTYLHLILSSLFPIFTASHASLSRPSSAAKPTKKTAGTSFSDDEEEEVYQRMEGLTPSDAFFFPLIAGLTLGGLYLIIKWLEDPSILNKILGWYFGVFGIFGIAKLVGDVLNVIHSFAFPDYYREDGHVWQVDGEKREARPLTKSGQGSFKRVAVVRYSPLPGLFGRIQLPPKISSTLWLSRELLTQKITFKVYIHKLIARRAHTRPFAIVGFFIGFATAVYSNLVAKPWWLTNLSGFAFSYTALQLMSPTTFGTGSLILAALFCYDIYMVFFTPMMVTVAKALEIPIKLEFPRPLAPGQDPKTAGNAMLGLGDIVLPGLMVGLALRFDLYLHYRRKQKQLPAPSSGPVAISATTVEKAVYVPPARNWSNHFWTTPWFGTSATDSNYVETGAFRKTYFNVSLAGYVLGMLATLTAMDYSKHPQPALLYLVPGVVSALWLTALIRGEAKLMYDFTESIEEEPEKKTESGNQKDSEKAEASERQPSFLSLASRKKNNEMLAISTSIHIEGGSGDEREVIFASEPNRSDSKRRASIAKVEQLENEFRHDKSRDWFYFAISSHAPLNKIIASEEEDKAPTVANKNATDERANDRLKTWINSAHLVRE